MIGPKRPKPTRDEKRAAHAAVTSRSRGICEGCGRRPASDRHHRLHGSSGRIDSEGNLLDLCGGPGGMKGGNHAGCHGDAHSGALGYLFGWSVKAGNEPEEIPVYHRGDDVWTFKGRAIAHATAVRILFDRGVIADVDEYLDWFDEQRRVFLLGGAARS